jgi:hypothetical protein
VNADNSALSYGVPIAPLARFMETRMPYGRTISAVRYVSVLMTNLISDIF